jgi:hypothetical protein
MSGRRCATRRSFERRYVSIQCQRGKQPTVVASLFRCQVADRNGPEGLIRSGNPVKLGFELGTGTTLKQDIQTHEF